MNNQMFYNLNGMLIHLNAIFRLKTHFISVNLVHLSKFWTSPTPCRGFC